MRKKTSLKDKLENWYMPIPESGCWVWMGALAAFGYGNIIDENGKNMGAHRASYIFHKGQIPEGMCVLHRCDVPACINPSHLFLGTKKDNIHDMWGKNRDNHAKGERAATAKLTSKDVVEIRNSDLKNHELAKLYGVTDSAIHAIKNRVNWKHVP